MSSDEMELVQLAVMILVPIVPAYLLFRALPSQANVDGPMGAAGGLFGGLHLKLAGAFGGYFAVLVLVFALHGVWHPPSPYQVWSVSGTLHFKDGSPFQMMDGTRIEVEHPPGLHVNGDGTFDLMISTMPGPGGDPVFPKLTVGNPHYAPLTIRLDDPKIMNDKKRSITVDAELDRIPAYGGAAPAAAPAHAMGGQ